MKNALLLLTFLSTLTIAHAQTNVSGGIYTNTTWTLANSPYIVTDTLTLFPSVTLTINPGVQVKFDNNMLFEIRGSLIAIGTLTDTISFTSNSVTPTQTSWQGLILNTGLGGVANIRFCKLMHATYGINIYFGGTSPINIKRTTFENNFSGIAGYTYSGTVAVDSSTFNYNSIGIGMYFQSNATGYIQVTNSRFQSNKYGISGTESVNATNCIFCGHEKAIYVERGNFNNCTVINNGVGVSQSNTHGITVTNCTIAKNDTGLVLPSGGSATNNIHQNNICSNFVKNVVHMGSYNENLTNNCWCSTDSSAISSSIYDGYDNVALGLVDFIPLINCDTTILPVISNCGSIPTTINEQTVYVIASMEIYPNPFSTWTTLRVDNNFQNASLTVCNSFGQTVKKMDNLTGQTIVFHRDNLPSGLYFVRLTQDGNTISADKFVITDK